MDNKNRNFLIYRYQVIPDMRSFIPDMLNGIETVDNLRKNKTFFFREALNFLQQTTKLHKIRFIEGYKSSDSSQYLFRLQAQRTKRVEQNFEKKLVPHQPSIWMAIDTNEDIQVIAIEQQRDFSTLLNTPLNALKKQLNKLLKDKYLIVKINPIQKPSTFWRFVKEHEDDIKEVEFEVSAPNMSELTSMIGLEMSTLLSTTNSSTGNIAMKAANSTALVLDEGNDKLKNLVSHVEAGGGDYKFRLKGSNKKSSPVGKQEEVAAPVREKIMGELENLETERISILSKLRKLFRLSKS